MDIFYPLVPLLQPIPTLPQLEVASLPIVHMHWRRPMKRVLQDGFLFPLWNFLFLGDFSSWPWVSIPTMQHNYLNRLGHWLV